MNSDITDYNNAQDEANRIICDLLAEEIQKVLEGNTTSKIWHGSPVWFSEGNPITGYGVLKDCVRLLFWSGQAFDEPGLSPEGSFRATEARYTSPDQINVEDLQRWCQKALDIQYNYKDIVKNRGKLDRIK